MIDPVKLYDRFTLIIHLMLIIVLIYYYPHDPPIRLWLILLMCFSAYLVVDIFILIERKRSKKMKL